MTRSERSTRRRGSGQGDRLGTNEAGRANRTGEPGEEKTDGGEPEQARTQAELREEIAELEERLDAYETREQQVIDRYEQLLAEQRRRKPEDGGDSRTARPADVSRRLRRTKRRLLRTFGLR